MALSNLFQPNDYELYSGSLNFGNGQSTLDKYYESGSLTDLTYSLAGTTTTNVPYGTNVLTRPQFVRVGNLVTCILPRITFTPSASVTNDIIINGLDDHEIFVPTDNVPVPTVINTVTFYDATPDPLASEFIPITVLSDGTIHISLNELGAPSWGTNQLSISPLSFSYVVDI